MTKKGDCLVYFTKIFGVTAGVVDVRIFASVTFVALLSATTVPALADQFEWGPLTTRPRNDQNTIWEARCNDSSEMWCQDNAPLLREAARYRTSA